MKGFFIVLFLLFSTISIYSQGSVTIFSGYGQSSFDDNLFDEETSFEQAGYIPIGIQAGYTFTVLPIGSLFVGAEVNHAVSPPQTVGQPCALGGPCACGPLDPPQQGDSLQSPADSCLAESE